MGPFPSLTSTAFIVVEAVCWRTEAGTCEFVG